MSEAIAGLIGVIIGSIMTFSKEVVVAWRERRREGSYSAIRLICILAEYVDKCVDVVQEDSGKPIGHDENGKYYHSPIVPQPKPPDYPDDISWRSLPIDIMHRALALTNKARSTDRYINSGREYGPAAPYYEGCFNARREGYAKLGLDAINIVADLRKHFRIPAADQTDLDLDWDPKEFLRAEIAKFDEQRAKEKARTKAERDKLQKLLGSDNE